MTSEPSKDLASQGFIGAESRKGEIILLRENLQLAIDKRDLQGQVNAMKKIIDAMTLGSDCSDLYATIVMASQTQHLVLKKMIYLYLQKYSAKCEELAILAMASYQRDMNGPSAELRGLSLRSFCSLFTNTLAMDVVEPLERGMTDRSPYVRRYAAIGCAKLFRTKPEFVTENLIQQLRKLSFDDDPRVSANSLKSLDEIMLREGGIEIRSELVVMLMKRIHTYNVWDQCYILNLIHKYDPANDNELFAIMNLLDGRLTHQNSGVVFATVRIFLKYVDLKPELQESVYFRIKNPIISLLITANPELQFSIYSHILFLSKQEPGLFHKEYKQFYVNSRDPEFLKIIKVQILRTIASPVTIHKILIEFEDYITDADEAFAREVIGSLSRLAVRIPSSSKQILQILLDALEIAQLPYVVETAIIVLQEMLFVYSSQSLDILPRLAPSLEIIQDPKAIAAVITMIGNYGATIAESPYLIEELVEKWDANDEVVKYALLHSTLNIFFLRPLEVKPILSKVFQNAIKDVQYPDVHDRAVFFYQLLATNVEKCRKLVSLAQKKNPDQPLSHDRGSDLQSLVSEFNTLSIVYCEHSNRFLKEHSQFLSETAQSHVRVKAYDEPKTVTNNNALQSRPNNTNQSQQQVAVNNNANQPQIVMDGQPGEEEGFEIGISLLPDPVMDPPAFQKLWVAWPVGSVMECDCTGEMDVESMAVYLSEYCVKTLAKGKVEQGYRLFLYGTEEESTEPLLAELIIDLNNHVAKATIKTELPEEYITEFSNLLEALCSAV